VECCGVKWSGVSLDKITCPILYQREGVLVGPDGPKCGTRVGRSKSFANFYLANDLLQ
jgi:hypothetical protein